MVLVDTSVWIRFLASRGPHASALDALLARDEVVGHELIYGELLIGDRGGRREFLSSYEQMHQVAVIPHGEVVAFVRDRHLAGRGIGWVDVHLLASALVSGTQLWTADTRFAAVVRDFGVGYDTFIT
jgi:predicted nucleic acid-binding protein